MFNQIADLKYPFDIKNIKPYEAQIKSAFSNKKQMTYNVSSFSAVKYECSRMIAKLLQEDPKLKQYEFEFYVKYAVSKLPEGSTLVNRIVFLPSVNHNKKFIYINLQLHWKQEESVQEEIVPEELVTEEPSQQPTVETRRRRRPITPREPSDDEEPDLLNL